MTKSSVLFVLIAFVILISSCNHSRKPDQLLPDVSHCADSVHWFDSVVNATKISDPDYAKAVAVRAIAMVQDNPDQELNARIYLIAGIAFQLTAPDSAFNYYQLACDLAGKSGADAIKPRILYNIGMLYKAANNYREAITFLDSAQRMASKERDAVILSNCYNSLGYIEVDLNNTARAVVLFTNALQAAKENNLPIQTGVALASLSRFEKNRSKANLMRHDALEMLKSQPEAAEQTGYLLANIGDDCLDPDSAIRYYRQAGEIAKKGHLVELEIACLNNMACSFSEKNNLPEALRLLRDEAIPLAGNKKLHSWLSTVYDSYAEISYLAGHKDTAYLYQKKALETAALADREQASNQVRLLNALLQARSRELTILEQTSKLDEQSWNVRLLTYMVVGLTILAILVILAFIVYRQRKNIGIQKLEIASAKLLAEIEEKEKERLSIQLHDMIRPLKSTISNHIENLESVEPAVKIEWVTALEKITGSLRQLSHRMNPVIRHTMEFAELCEGIRQDFTLSGNLSIRIEIDPPDLKITPVASNHIYFIVYELLTNAEKHLGKGKIELSISSEFDNLYILYKDDGKGFDQDRMEINGLGIILIRKRVLLMGGNAFLETDNLNGTRWTITIPGSGNILLN